VAPLRLALERQVCQKTRKQQAGTSVERKGGGRATTQGLRELRDNVGYEPGTWDPSHEGQVANARGLGRWATRSQKGGRDDRRRGLELRDRVLKRTSTRGHRGGDGRLEVGRPQETWCGARGEPVELSIKGREGNF